MVMASLLEEIFCLEFSEDVRNNEHTLDKPYLHGMLSTFVNFPPLSYNEVHLEYNSKKLVGAPAEKRFTY